MQDSLRYLQPQVVAQLANMELRARLVVEGFITGLHKSPYHGFSVEFTEHRPYMPGDEIKHIDWKAYGKTDRYYIKMFEEEYWNYREEYTNELKALIEEIEREDNTPR